MVGRLALVAVALGAALGGLCAWGYPGVGLWPLYILGLAGASLGAQVLPRRSALLFSAGFALHYPLLFVGTLSWGATVPWLSGAALFVCFGLPVLAWSHLVAPRLGSAWVLFLATLAFAWLVQEFFEQLGWPFAPAAVLPSWLLGGARWLGAGGVSGILVAWCVTLGFSLCRWRERARSAARAGAGGLGLTALAPGIALLLLSGAARLTAPPPERQVRVGVPQVDVARVFYEHQAFNRPMRQAFDTQLDAMLTSLTGAELIVTPEELDNRFHLNLAPSLARWQEVARRQRTAVLLSAPLATPAGRANAIAGLDATGALVGVHRKVDLAPFGEARHVAGQGYAPLQLGGGLTVGPLVCLEGALRAPYAAHVAGGAGILAIATDDLSFGSSPLPFLHLAMAQLRAVEAGRDVVWASNGGPSGSIDRFGAFTAAAPFREAAAARLSVSVHSDVTPALAAGAWPLSVLGLGLVAIGAKRLRGRRSATWAPPGSWRVGLGSGLAALFLGVLLLPLVELSHGRSANALGALWEPFAAPPPGPSGMAFEAAEHPAAGAVTFFLAELGLFLTPREVAAALPPDATRESMVKALGALGVELAPGAWVLEVPMLAQASDGTWAELACPTGSACLVYAAGRQELVPVDEVRRRASVLLLPTELTWTGRDVP